MIKVNFSSEGQSSAILPSVKGIMMRWRSWPSSIGLPWMPPIWVGSITILLRKSYPGMIATGKSSV